MKRLIITILIIGSLFFLYSCDPSDFELPAHQGDFYIPILDIELSISDLILADTTEILQEDTTGLVSLHYDLSASRELEEIAPIDDWREGFTIPGVPGDIPNFELDIPLYAPLLGIDTGFYSVFEPATFNYEGTVDIEEFLKAEFDSGLIELEITNNFPLALSAGLVIELINEGEEIPFIYFSLDSTINPGETYIFSDQDLTDKFLTGHLTFRIVDLHTPGGTDISIDDLSTLDVRISFNEISLVKATFMQPDVDLPSVKIDLPLLLPNGARIKKARLDSGYLLIEIPELENIFYLKLTLLTAIQNNNPLSFDLIGTKTEVPLHNLEIDLTTSVIPYNVLPLELQLVFNESLDSFDIDFNKPLNGFIEIFDIDYDFLTGYLGTSNELLKASEHLDFFNRIRFGTITFDVPRITIGIGNGLGATATVRDDGQGLYIKGKNERLYGDTEVSFGSSLEGFTLPSAFGPGLPSYSVYEINKENEPEFGDFLSLFPTYIEVRIPVKAGTDEIDMDQFINDDDLIAVDVGLELPMNLAADRFVISDTTEFSLDFDPEKFEAQRISLEARFESYYPVELTFQTLFLDDNYVLLDSLFDNIKVIEPAIIGDNGKVTEPLTAEFFTELEKEDLDQIRQVAYAVPVIKMQTPEGDFVQLYSSYKIKIKVKGQVLTDIDLNR
jgi:hypothetical protein